MKITEPKAPAATAIGDAESGARLASYAGCVGDCEIKEYTYSVTRAWRLVTHEEAIPKQTWELYRSDNLPSETQQAIQAFIDKLSKSDTSACPRTGCLCIKNRTQTPPYPKDGPTQEAEKTTTTSSGLQLMFELERTSKIYSGQCDEPL